MKAVVAGVAFGLCAAILAAYDGMVVSADGAPVRGATVIAYRAESEEAQLDRIVANVKRTALAKATTDAGGTFTLGVSGNGVIVVSVEAPGFAPEVVTRSVDEPGSPIALRRARFRDGSVRSADGPVAAARVVVLGDKAETETRSDEHGHFHVAAPASMREVLVVHPGYAPLRIDRPSSADFLLVRGSTVSGTIVPAGIARIRIDGVDRGVSSADGTFSIAHVAPSARMISAETEETFGATTLKPRVTIAMKSTLTLRGVVRDRNGTPVAGVRLSAGGRQYLTAVADENGSYAFRHLAAGPWMIFVASAEWTAYEIDVDLKASAVRDVLVTRTPQLTGTVKLDDGRPLFGATVTAVARGVDMLPGVAVTDVDGRFRVRVPNADATVIVSAVRRDLPPARAQVALKRSEPWPDIAMTVTKGIEVTGAVVDPTGAPVGGVAIAPDDASGTVAETKPDGTFAVHLPKGDWTLRFSKDGFLRESQHNIRVGTALEPLHVVLRPAAAVQGRVTRHDGSPAAGVRVMFETNNYTNFASSGGDGRFELKNVPPGTGMLRYQPEGMAEGQMAVKAPAGDVAIVLPETGSIHGQVVDPNGAPVSDFAINDESVSTTDGSFELRDAAAGSIELTFTSRGFLEAKKTIEVVASKSIDAGTIVLSRGRTLRGVITATDGTPLPDARANLKESGVTTGEDGRYELSGVDFGETLVNFEKEGFVPLRRTIAAGQNDETIDIRLARGMAVTGRVLRADGSPARASVSAWSAVQGAASETEDSDASGTFHFAALVPGRYDFSARENETYATGSVTDVDVAAVHDITIHLQAPTKAAISGAISGVDLSTVDRTTVMARALDGSGATSAIADATGTYVLENVPAGWVTVHAIAGHRTSRVATVEVTPDAQLHVDLPFAAAVDVHGRVTRGGKPLGGTALSFTRSDDQSDSANAVSDDDGTFAVSLTEGPYRVYAGGATVEKEVRAGSPMEIAIDNVKISVTVVDGESALPIGGAVVSTQDQESSTQTRERGQTDASGQLTFDAAHVPPHILVRKDGYASASVDGQTPAIVKLTRSAGTLVRLVDARDGRTLTGYAIARDAAGHVIAAAGEAGEDGSMRIPVGPGTWRFSGSASEYGSQTVVAPVSSNEVVIPLRRGGKLLVVSDGNLLATARLIQADGEEYVRCWCNGVAEIRITGRVTLVDSIAPGPYTLEVTPDGGKARSYPVSVVEGQTVTVAIQ